MKNVFLISAMLVSLSCLSQALPKEEQGKVDNAIRAIKSEYQFDTPKACKPYYVKVEHSDTMKMRFTCRATIQKDQNPLIIVDGKEIPFEQLKSVNPSEIDSINIFKDSTASALFGTKATYGVIVINMKCKEQKVPSL